MEILALAVIEKALRDYAAKMGKALDVRHFPDDSTEGDDMAVFALIDGAKVLIDVQVRWTAEATANADELRQASLVRSE